MSEEMLAENETERQRKIDILAKTLVNGLTGKEVPTETLNNLAIQSIGQRLIEIVSKGDTAIPNINTAIAYIVRNRDLYAQNATEIKEISRLLLLRCNLEYINQVKDQLIGQLNPMASLKKLMSDTFNPKPLVCSYQGVDIRFVLLINTVFGNYPIDTENRITIAKLENHVNSQFQHGINTAIEIFAQSYAIILANNSNIEHLKAWEIIQKSYVSVMIPLMLTPLKIFSEAIIILRKSHNPNILSEIVELDSEGQKLIFKSNDEIFHIFTILIQSLSEQELDNLEKSLNGYSQLVGCPFLYSGTYPGLFTH